MKDPICNFWKEATPTVFGMTQHEKSENIDLQEQEEILGYLPDLKGKKVLELASGIGRFTGRLAKQSDHVTTVDFASHFIEKNQEIHKKLSNIIYHVADAMDLSFDDASFDVVFINWLCIYLSEEETKLLFKRISKWLAKGGIFFFRESIRQTKSSTSGKYTAIYRTIEDYSYLAKKHFETINHDIVMTYLLQYKSTDQHYWLCQKN